jgi:hypothetical protein
MGLREKTASTNSFAFPTEVSSRPEESWVFGKSPTEVSSRPEESWAFGKNCLY